VNVVDGSLVVKMMELGSCERDGLVDASSFGNREYD
jgi:hypothetical protein